MFLMMTFFRNYPYTSGNAGNRFRGNKNRLPVLIKSEKNGGGKQPELVPIHDKENLPVA